MDGRDSRKITRSEEIEKVRGDLFTTDSLMRIGTVISALLLVPFLSLLAGDFSVFDIIIWLIAIPVAMLTFSRWNGLHRKAIVLVEQKYAKILRRAHEREAHLDYKKAISLYEDAGKPQEAARVRRIMYDEKKVDQTVVQGDQVTKTEIKDSVLNRSNVGAGGKSKTEEIKELKELLDSGAIDDDEFKQMKKEILGK
jgi:hypothetical protein